MNMFKKYGIPLLIILLAAVVARGMIKRKAEPEKLQSGRVIPSVSVLTLKPSEKALSIVGNAVVQPFQKVNIVPEVKGKVTYVSEKLSSGALIKKGELLLKINDKDYRYNLQSVQSNFENAKLGLLMEQEESRIAKEQWEEYQSGNPNATASLFTLREPQLKKAEVTLKSAEAQVGIARLNLNRTKITSPFNAVAVTKSVDVGQVVGASPVTVLYGTDLAKLIVPLSREDLEILGDLKGTEVTVQSEVQGKLYSWKGKVLGTSPELNPASRMVDVIVTVANPLTQNPDKELQFGTYTDILFQQTQKTTYYTIPRKALSNGNSVNLVEDGRLQKKSVRLLKWDGDFAHIEGDLKEGDQLITTVMDLTVDSMEVKVQ